MKSFKKVLATTLAAAMVITAVPVSSANAAAQPKLSATKKTYYAGKSYKLKVTTPSSWKSVKVTSKSSKKSVATVKTSKKTITVKAVKAGKSTVTVKVTGKNKKGKKLSKTLKCAVTVKNPSIALDQKESTLAVGEAVALKATVKPASAGTVTYTTSDEKVATVANGTVTAVAAGEATITATAKCGTKTLTATSKVTVKKTILKEAKQTKATQIEATVAGDTKDLKAADFKVTNTATNATVAVKSAAAKKDAPNIIVIDTFTDMKDAKEYSVEYDGMKVSFTATDGAVAKVGLTKTEVPAGKLTEVKLVTLDKNDVVLDDSTSLTASDSSKGKVTSEIKLTKGYTENTSIYLPAVGDTADVKVTYHSGTFGTDGKETGNIEQSFTIKAIDPALVNLKYAVTIGTSAPAWKAASFKANDKLAIGSEKNAYFRITDDNGDDIDNYADYKVKSADQTKILVEEVNLAKATEGSNAVKVTGVAEGTTYILVTKDDKTVASLPVTVQGKPVATTLDLDRPSVTVVAAAAYTENVKLTLKDQYGESMDINSIDVAVLGKPDGATDPTLTKNASAKTVSFAGSNFDKDGAFTFKITAKNGDKSVDRTLTVNRVATKANADQYAVKCSQGEVDTTIGTGSDYDTATQITVAVAEMVSGGVKGEYSATVVDYVVKNAKGEEIAKVENGAMTKTCAAIDTYAAGKLTVKPVAASTVSGSAIYTKNLEAGTYTVTAKFTNAASKAITVSGSFTIKDTQDSKASCNIKNNKFGLDNTVAAAFMNQTLVEVYYDGVKQTITNVIDVDGTALSNGGAYVKSVKLYVNVSGSNNYFNVTVPVNASIASCSGLK